MFMSQKSLNKSLFLVFLLFITKSYAKEAVFAGGCFWCVESAFEKHHGVLEVVSGFSGGTKKNISYKIVSSGATKYREAVLIKYDEKIISYSTLLNILWHEINPTDAGGQFVDRGFQYSSAIFYQSEQERKLAINSRDNMQQSGIFKGKIITSIEKFISFIPAEDYHQNYYKKNPIRYNTYRYSSGRDKYLDKIWGENHKKFKIDYKGKLMSYNDVKKKLTKLQYKVTQKDGTEPAFKNEYWDNKDDGIYVDIVSGEALFSSTDKFKSGTGWPSFTKVIDGNQVQLKKDRSLFLRTRVEVRSELADSHLGHVFDDGPAPTNKRFCINSAALRFVPVSEMKAKGYEKYLKLFAQKTK